MDSQKKQISLWANPQEISRLQKIMAHYERNTLADTIRFLINQEAKKICPSLFQ